MFINMCRDHVADINCPDWGVSIFYQTKVKKREEKEGPSLWSIYEGPPSTSILPPGNSQMGNSLPSTTTFVREQRHRCPKKAVFELNYSTDTNSRQLVLFYAFIRSMYLCKYVLDENLVVRCFLIP